jgi:hypothetical protein
MSIVTAEKKEEYKAIIRRVKLFNPSMSVLELQRRLAEAETPIKISYDYLTTLTKEMRQDRIDRLNQETKEDLYNQIAETVEFVNQQLRAIAQEEKLVYSRTKDGVPVEKAEVRIYAQQNRIKALNSVIDNLKTVIELKMDLGLIERRLGTADFRIIDMMQALEKIRNGDYTTPIEHLIATRTDEDSGEQEGGHEDTGSSLE